MSRFSLSRRTVLKGILGGVGATVALPTLEAMLNANGTAYADGTALPTVFGTGYFANGGLQDRYTPTTTGANFVTPPQLQPFADAGVQKYLSVASNMAHMTLTGNAHFAEQGWAFAAGTGETMDQTISERWKKIAPSAFDNIHVKIVRHINGGGNIGTLPNDNVNGCNNSWSQGPQGNPICQTDPQAVFQMLFGMTKPPGTTTVAADALAQTQVLSIVNDDAKRLYARLGKNDQTRMQAFYANIADLQSRVNMPHAACTFPTASSVPAYKQPVNEAEFPDENGYVIYDLITTALACGLTRTFDILWSSSQCDGILQEAKGSTFPNGLDYYYHGIQHAGEGMDPREVKYIPIAMKTGAVDQAVMQAMRHWAYLGKSMLKWQIGSGTLLDQALVWITSDYGNGITHDGTGVPMMLLGLAGGKMKGNYHYAAPSNNSAMQNGARFGLTVLQALGQTDTQWGVNNVNGNGQTSSAITDFFA